MAATMLGNYLRVAFRQLAKQKLYAAINILGLAVGLASVLLVGLYVGHELSYDGYHANADRVYRMARNIALPNGVMLYDASMPPPVGPLLESEFAEIEEVARLRPLSATTVVVVDGDTHVGGWLSAADRELFRLFDFDWLEGSPVTALTEPYSIVLTESVARRYFGQRSAIGETLLLRERDARVTVTGVIRDLPDNTHLRFDMLVPLSLLTALGGNEALEHWNDGNFHTYALLRPGADVTHVQARSRELFVRHMPGGLGPLNDFVAQRLRDVHLSPQRFQDMKPKGRLGAVYASSAIAALILVIACVNFVNLATASARRRAKEVGVRKSLGVTRGQLVVQFLGEALLTTALAAMLGLAAVEILLPVVGAFLDVDLKMDYRTDPAGLLAVVGIVVVVGVAAGSFPAWYLSAFEPSKVLKGDLTQGPAAVSLRGVLVAVQLTISIALLVATGVVYRQAEFMRDADLGYDKEQIVVVSGRRSGRVAERWGVLKREWLKHPDIIAATASNQAPGVVPGMADLVRGEGGDLQAPAVDMRFVAVDPDFFSTYGIDMLAGRAFSADIGADAAAMETPTGGTVGILNTSGARALGWTPEEAVGKTFWSVPLNAAASGPPPDAPARQIVGVIGDIYFQPLREPIGPIMFLLQRGALDEAALKISGRDVEATLSYIDAVWARIVPEQPVARRFLDDDFDALYRREQRQGWMLSVCALLAIFLASLGLFGLASLTTEQRTKEIGIRKAVGGTVFDIVRLFGAELGKLALVANLVAWPVAYVAMQRWLGQFAYRIELGPALFVASGVAVLAIAWITVGVVAARAAAAKPLQSLRYE